MIQKIIKVGNSLGIIIPKELIEKTRLKEGEQLEVETYPALSMMTLRPKSLTYNIKITPEFKNWLDKFAEKNGALLKKLAKTP